ncbi:MAG TPA: transglycosylase SLT domain-containing protein [Fibrobacteraceae bacterium]|nr:transglycosylase SLT domain-containing protein [Fibrobacteraceae bacterium]
MKTGDLQGMDRNAATNGVQSLDPQKWKVAQDFEALFIHQMFKALRQTVSKDGLTQMSNGREIFTEMLDEEMSKEASRQGSLGLAQFIYRQLQPGDQAPSMAHAAYSQAAALNRKAQQPRRASKKDVDAWIQEAATEQNLDADLLSSLVQQESAGDSLARSPQGAMGLTQLMPDTARELGVMNPWNGRQNIQGGARYLKSLLRKYNGREDLALAAYNAGPGTVDRYAGIPPYAETQNYVRKVLDRRDKQQNREAPHGRP